MQYLEAKDNKSDAKNNIRRKANGRKSKRTNTQNTKQSDDAPDNDGFLLSHKHSLRRKYSIIWVKRQSLRNKIQGNAIAKKAEVWYDIV